MEKSVSDGRKTGDKDGARIGGLGETEESMWQTTDLKYWRSITTELINLLQ